MCEYCEFDENGAALSHFSVCSDAGFLGGFHTFAGVARNKHGFHKLDVWMMIDSDPLGEQQDNNCCIGYDLMHVKINYCPMCGRKLGEYAES